MSRLFQKLVKTITIDESQSAFIRKGISGSLVMEILAKVMLFVITLVLTHHLSAADYGKYSYFMGLLISFATIATFGLDDLIIRQLGDKDDTKANRLNSPALAFTLLVAGALAVMLYWGSDTAGMGYLAGAIVFLTMQYMLSSILKGKKHILSAQIPEQVIRLGVLLSLILFQVYWIQDYSFEIIARVIFSSAGISLFVSGLLLMRKENWNMLFPMLSFRSFFTAELFLFAALSLFGVFRHKLDVLMLGWYGMMVETGVYNICSKLSDLILIGLMLTNVLYMPLFAARKDDVDTTPLSKVLKSSAVLNAVIGGVLLVLFVLLGKPILGIFGSGFEDGYSALIVLSVSTFIYAIIGPYIVMLMMVGYAKDVLIGLMIGVAIQFLLASLLIPDAPVYGMAISKGVAIVFIQIFMMMVAWRRLQIKPFFLST